LQRLVEAFQVNPRVGWAYSDIDEIDREGRLITKSYLSTQGIYHPKRSLIEFIGQDLFILPSTSLVLKKAFEQVNGFDERLSGCEDDDLFLRLFLTCYDSSFIPEPLSQWRVRYDSASSSERMSKSRDIYARKLIDTFPDEPLMARYYCRDCIAPRFYVLALKQYQKFLVLGQWEECLKHLKRMQLYNQMLYKSLPGLLKRHFIHLLMAYPVIYRHLYQFSGFLFPWWR
jgi:GT2 family glycosyltransferase